jgi:hypothetical protein
VNVNLPDTAFVGEAAKRKFLEERGMGGSSSGIIIAGKSTPKARRHWFSIRLLKFNQLSIPQLLENR